jgi:MATE family multidrug resistance protein
MIGWSAFMFYLGRIDTVSLAATTVAFRINGLAFFPVIGLASAAAVLIGHAQGRHMPALSARITKRCMVLAEAWMLLWAVAFIALPHQLFAIFGATDAGNEAMTAQIAAAGVVMLRFVAIYCILDSCNIVYVFALQAAGDTRWTFVATIILYGGFVAALSIADALHATMAAEWTMVTIFAMTTAAVWVARFLQGKWRTIQVIESDIEVA